MAERTESRFSKVINDIVDFRFRKFKKNLEDLENKKTCKLVNFEAPRHFGVQNYTFTLATGVFPLF